MQDLLKQIAEKAREAGVFGEIRVSPETLECEAKDSAEPATYRVAREDGALWVSLVMADRWQSESIESDLMHSGDKLEELLEEELVDLGYEGDPPTYQHYRSDDLLFTFRSKVPEDADQAALWLLAYEQCFRNLGDMSAEADED
jgi:hypothetical protein